MKIRFHWLIILSLNLLSNSAFADIPDFMTSFSEPYERLQNETWEGDCSGETVDSLEIAALEGEYHAIGLVLTNCSPAAVDCNIFITDLGATTFAYELRRQVFIETYYPDINEIADPLTKLLNNGDNWVTTVPGNSTVKLYIELQIPQQTSGIHHASIDVQTDSGTEQLSLLINVLRGQTPDYKLHKYCAFIYPSLNVAHQYKSQTANDLKAHGTVMMEFPILPNVSFDTYGNIVSISYGVPDATLSKYGPRIDQIMIFWESEYDNFEINTGGTLTPYTEAWDNAFKNLLEAWLDHAASYGTGFDVGHFTILPFDEPHSASFAVSPDQSIVNFQHVSDLIREVEPALQIVLTLDDYAGPNDVNALLPCVDIILPVWPYRTFALSGQPSGYNPRQAYYNLINPSLHAWRNSTGGQVWSYHISGGKSDNVRIAHRAYPILAFADGTTGTGHWAYNVASGSTWDDKDGSSLDYSLIYHGLENHPLRITYNVTNEIVVPSIRWKALRAGIQDARLLAYLKSIQPQLSPAQQLHVQELINEAVTMADDFMNSSWSSPNTPSDSYWRHPEDYDAEGGIITFPYLTDYSKRLRQAYSAVCPYTIVGDHNNDCRVDLKDLDEFILNWLVDCISKPSNSVCLP